MCMLSDFCSDVLLLSHERLWWTSSTHIHNDSAGGAEISPGQTLEMTIKVPDNLMPTADFKLVPVEAAYSDDEQEVALARENRKVTHLLCCLD